MAGLDLTVLNDLVSGELTEEQLARLLAGIGSAKRAGSALQALTQVVAAARKAVAAPDQAGGGGGSGAAGPGGGPGVASGQPDADVVLLENAPTASNPVPSKDGTSDQPAQLDPDLKEFMGRAERSGQGSYVELEGDLSEDSLTVGRVLSGMATVQILTKVKGFDEAGEATESERWIWYGGRARFKVVGRSPGRVEVVRSTMEGYTRHGRYGGTVQAARLTLGDQRQPVAVGAG